jgi:hypothetical protein
MPLHDWTVDQRTVRYAGASLRNELRLPESHDVLAVVLTCKRSINELRLSAPQLWLDTFYVGRAERPALCGRLRDETHPKQDNNESSRDRRSEYPFHSFSPSDDCDGVMDYRL